MKLINDIRKKTAVGSEHTISHVSSELSIRFGQVSRYASIYAIVASRKMFLIQKQFLFIS